MKTVLPNPRIPKEELEALIKADLDIVCPVCEKPKGEVCSENNGSPINHFGRRLKALLLKKGLLSS